MSDDNETKSGLVVKAAYVTVLTQVGAGKAYVDIPSGERLPDDLSQEDRDRLTASGAIGEAEDSGDYSAAARPVPGEVEPDEIPGDLLPGGSVEQILAWVGDDLARARVARDMEEAKGPKARASLLAKLDEVKEKTETEPPAVPEAIDNSVQPAPVGGVVSVTDDSDVEGKPADAVAAPAKRSRR